jgi:hypothetical protein
MNATMETKQEEERQRTRWHEKEERAWELSALEEDQVARDTLGHTQQMNAQYTTIHSIIIAWRI